jgi:transmembrane sensor
MWQAIQAEHGSLCLNAKKSRLPLILTYGGIVAAASVLIGLVLLFRPAKSGEALTTDDGEPIPFVIPAEGATSNFRFSDGSSLLVDSGSELRLIESSGGAVRFALNKGRSRFDITPGGPRKWQVDLGNVLVTVLGTAFTVEKDASHVSVEVERGVVSVSGDGVESGEQRLIAGKSLRVDNPPSSTPQSPANNMDPRFDESLIEDTEDRQEIGNATRKSPASDERNKEAFADLDPAGFAAAADRAKSTDELFRLADAARRGGHPENAVVPLRTIIHKFAEDSKAGLAAYTLGRLYLEELSSPKEASSAFDEALTLGIPDALKEGLTVKLARSLLLVGDARGKSLAGEYLMRYPKGRYREQVKGWISEKQQPNQ